MKFFISIYFFIICIQNIDLNTIRNNYKSASYDKTKIGLLNSQLVEVNKDSSPVLLAYKGAAIALKGKYAIKLKNKKHFFIEGISLLEFALEKDPNNIETRFIRLVIQEKSPKLLKYKSNIVEDKHYILLNFKLVKSSDLKKYIIEYVLQSNVFTEKEKIKLNKEI